VKRYFVTVTGHPGPLHAVWLVPELCTRMAVRASALQPACQQ